MNTSTFLFPHSMKACNRGGRLRVFLPLLCLLAIFAAAPATAQAPSPPTGFSVPDNGEAVWVAVTGATAYSLEVQVGTTGSVATLFPGIVTGVNFYQAPNATNCCKNGTTYRARINVTTSAGTSEWSDWDSFTFNGTTSFTGTAFSVSISLSYDWDNGTLRITTSTSGGTGPLSTTECTVNDGPRFQCGTGTTARSRAAGLTYTVVAFGQRQHETHTASATIVVPAASTDSGDPGDSDKSSRRRSSGDSDSSPILARNPVHLPIPTQDHSQLPTGAEVHSSSPWIQFREIEVGYVGQQAVIDAGARAAIDVWSPLPLQAEICFEGVGSLLLLDAAFSPRLRVPLESYLRAGKTCGQLDRAGTVVLMPGEPTYTVAPTASPPSGETAALAQGPDLIADSLDTKTSLENCTVRSLVVLNFRARPAGQVIGWFIGATTAMARTPNWFQIAKGAVHGWVSARYVTASGDCG